MPLTVHETARRRICILGASVTKRIITAKVTERLKLLTNMN